MAEFLIKARDTIDLPKDKVKRNRCYMRGDIVVVMPDGHEWGKEERLPKFVVVKIAGMPVETAKKYIEPQVVDSGLVDVRGRAILRMTARRKWKILMDAVPTAAKTALTKSGIHETSWSNIKTYVYDKANMVTL